MKKIFLIFVLGLSLLLGGAVSVDAVNESPPAIGIENDLLPGSQTYEDISSYDGADQNLFRKFFLQNQVLGNIVRTLTGIISAVAVLVLVIAGYSYLTARGNEEQIKKAHHTIVVTGIALIIMLFAYSIVNIIINFTSLV